jgi:hypothetical protein
MEARLTIEGGRYPRRLLKLRAIEDTVLRSPKAHGSVPFRFSDCRYSAAMPPDSAVLRVCTTGYGC